ncbi:hypothetical protein D043_0854B, partial [Vibrio parahaemolyticus EKP-021]
MVVPSLPTSVNLL